MIIENTSLKDLKIITSEPFYDERGYFGRVFCQKELAEIKENIIIEQINHSLTKQKGTIRGMHFQYPPHAEMKIIRCTKGSIFDVAVDLRKNSPTFLKWHGEILSAENMKSIVIPEGFAHGFQTLEDDCEMVYLHTKAYCKEAEGALRFDEPLLNISWPLSLTAISERDLSHNYVDEKFEGIMV